MFAVVATRTWSSHVRLLDTRLSTYDLLHRSVAFVGVFDMVTLLAETVAGVIDEEKVPLPRRSLFSSLSLLLKTLKTAFFDASS